MSMNLTHDPAAHLDYQWDWSSWLDAGETVTAHTIAVIPDSEMLIDSHSATPTTVTAWMSGGVLGRTYQLTCHITTSAARQDDRKFTLSVANR